MQNGLKTTSLTHLSLRAAKFQSQNSDQQRALRDKALERVIRSPTLNILKRVREISNHGIEGLTTGGATDFFLYQFDGKMNRETLDRFCELDDIDFSFAVKRWSNHPDFVLSELCKRLLNRQLLKIHLQAEPFNEKEVQEKLIAAAHQLNISPKDAEYFVFTGEANNTMYKTEDERINILFKDGMVKDISAIDNPLIHQTISAPVKKFYICSLN